MDRDHKSPADIVRNTLQELARSGKPPTPLNYALTYFRFSDRPQEDFCAALLELTEIFAQIEEDNWTLKQLERLKDYLPKTVLVPEEEVIGPFSEILNELLLRNRGFAKEVQHQRKEFEGTVSHLNELIGKVHIMMNQTANRLEKSLNRFNTVRTLEEARPIFTEIIEQSRSLLAAMREIGDDFQEAHKNLMNSTIEANLDPLTGTLNRRGFMKRLDSFVQKNIVLMIFDLDHFKELNDRKGHHHGDQVLQRLSAETSKNLEKRPNIFCRWGGDEFLVLFPDASLDEIASFSETIRSTVLSDGDPGNSEHPLTISIGISAGFLESSDLFDTFYNLADQALYIAKKEGRNRIRAIHIDDQEPNAKRPKPPS